MVVKLLRILRNGAYIMRRNRGTLIKQHCFILQRGSKCTYMVMPLCHALIAIVMGNNHSVFVRPGCFEHTMRFKVGAYKRTSGFQFIGLFEPC
jgi:hypothetical protein